MMGCKALISKLTAEQEEMALNAALECKSLGNIAKLLGFTSDMTFYRYCKNNTPFYDALKATRSQAYEELAYSVLAIVDEYLDPQQARVKLECIKNFLAWMDPAKYGNRVDVNVTQTIDIAGAIALARRRVELDVTPVLSDIEDLV